MTTKATVAIVTVVLLSVCVLAVVPMDQSDAVTAESKYYDYSIGYEQLQGTSGSAATQATLPSVDTVYIANTDDVVFESWYRHENNSDSASKYVITKINDTDTTKVRLGMESQGFGNVVSWIVDSEGKYWTGSLWDALHILANGGEVIVSGEVYATPDSPFNAGRHLESRGGFTVLGSEGASINNGTGHSLHIDTYMVDTLYPASSFNSIDYTFKSVATNFGFWINDFSLKNIDKEPGNIESLSLTLEEVEITSSLGSSFYSQSGSGTNVETSLAMRDTTINAEGSNATALYACYMDSVEVSDCTFNDCPKAIAITHRTEGQATVDISNTTFNDCGYGIKDQEASSAPISVSTRGNGSTALDVSNCDFNYIEKSSLNGDILLGSHDEPTSGDVQFSLETGDQPCIVKVWKGTSQEVWEFRANGSFKMSGIGVGQETQVVDNDPVVPPIIWDDDDDYVPPIVPAQPSDSGDDNTVTVVACAAAAVVAALMAAFLILDRKR